MDLGTTLLFSVIFGSIGLAYFIYGKKQHAPVPLISGIALSVYPYFVTNVYAMVIVGVLLIAAPWVIRL